MESTYIYFQGNYNGSAKECEPDVPIGDCMTAGVWRDKSYRKSVWFSFTAPTSGSIDLEMSTRHRVALWSATSCTDLLGGTPTLEYAMDPCYQSPFTHNIYCLTPGETYYLQVVDAYDNFNISLTEVTIPCGAITNDQCINATNVTVANENCTDYPVYTNIGATNSYNDASPPAYMETFGTDVWFSSVVPASGNLAIGFDEADNCSCPMRLNLYEGDCDNLNHFRTTYIYVDGREISYIKDLSPGDTVYYAVDFRNRQDTTGYFKMCVFDPSCLPVGWGVQTKVACANPEQFVMDVNINNLGTATSFDIINPSDNSIYYDNLTSTGTYRIGSFDRNANGPMQIIHQDDAFCNSEAVYYGMNQISDEPSNNNMCSATDLSAVINNGATNFTKINYANTEDCQLFPPASSNCDSDNGWSNQSTYTSTWASFTASSNNMALVVNVASTDYIDLRIAVWEADNCTALQDGNTAFVKGIEPCDKFANTAQLSFDNLEIGQNYFIQVVSFRDYSITLTAETPTTGDSSNFTGHWQHEDINTPHIPVTIIREANHQLFVHNFGSCSPTYCDWGEETIMVTDVQDGKIILEWNQGFAIHYDTLNMVNETTMQRSMHTTYLDDSGRASVFDVQK